MHSEITEKKRQRRGLQMAADVNQDSSKSVLFPVLGLGMDQLGADARDLLLNLVVLARGISAPVDMLTNLWERKVGRVFSVFVWTSDSFGFRWLCLEQPRVVR